MPALIVEPTTVAARPAPVEDHIEDGIGVLAKRLELGWHMIEDAKARGAHVPHWEDAWLRLLREYEDACWAGTPG